MSANEIKPPPIPRFGNRGRKIKFLLKLLIIPLLLAIVVGLFTTVDIVVDVKVGRLYKTVTNIHYDAGIQILDNTGAK